MGTRIRTEAERTQTRARARKWRKDHPEEARRISRESQRRVRADLRANEPEKLAQIDRRSRLRRAFGMSEEAYDRMLVAQDGLCAICLQPEFSTLHGKLKMLSVDHDHATGKVRGLLCTNCNHGIGKFKDDPDRMRAAIDYLERSK